MPYLSLASAPLAAYRNALVLTGDYTANRTAIDKIASAGKAYNDIYSEIKPSFEKVKKESYHAENFLVESGHDPKFLGLVGGGYSLPDYIFDFHITYFYWSAKSDYLFSPAPYGDIDNRLDYTEYPQQELEVGRIVGHSILDATMQLTKTFFYEDFLSNGKYRTLNPRGWERKASVIEGHRVNQPNSGGPPGSTDEPYPPAGEVNDIFSTAGYETTYYLPRNVTESSDNNMAINEIFNNALNSSMILINAHGGNPGKQALIEIGLDTEMDTEYTFVIDGDEMGTKSIAPAIVYLIGCDTGSIAFDFEKNEYLTLSFIHAGAVAYLAPETFQTVCFWDKAPFGPEASQTIYFFQNLLNQDISIGEALTEAKWKAYKEWENESSSEDDVGPCTLKLYGDPAFKPYKTTGGGSRQNTRIDSPEKSKSRQVLPNKNEVNPINLHWDESLTITGEAECGNISIKNFGRLIIKDADLMINGFINISGYGSLFIFNSKVTILPPPMNENISIFLLEDNSIVRIFESEVTFEHATTPTLAPFIVSGDSSTLMYINGTLNIKMPPIPRDPENGYAIKDHVSGLAGVLMLSDSAVWKIIGTTINVNVKYETINNSTTLLSSWYMGTLQGDVQMDFIDVYVNFYSASKLLEPIKGKLNIVNSLIIGGFLSGGLTETTIINSTILGDITIGDSSIVTITSTNFLGNIVNGVWTESEQTPESRVFIQDSNLGKDLMCGGKSHSEILNTTIQGGVSQFENCSIAIAESSVSGVVVQEGYGIIDSLNSTFISLFLKGEGKIDIENSLKTIDRMTLYFDYNGAISLSDSKLKRMIGYNEINVDILLKNSSIYRIDTSDNSTVSSTLINSEISELMNYGDNNNFLYIIKNSDIPSEPTGENLTTQIQYLLDVHISLNGEAVLTEVEVYKENELIISGFTSENGDVRFPLMNRVITSSGSVTEENYSIKTSYFGFSETKEIKLNKSLEVNFDWIDIEPPKSDDISYSPKTWNSDRRITVQATVTDADFKAITNVTIMYRIKGSSNWKKIQMHSLGNDEYEGIIPSKRPGAEVEFYIVANDNAKNSQNSPTTKYSIGQEIIVFYYVFIIVFISLLVVGARKLITTWISRKNYFNKYVKRKNVIIMEKQNET
jgi:hypothetical protein